MDDRSLGKNPLEEDKTPARRRPGRKRYRSNAKDGFEKKRITEWQGSRIYLGRAKERWKKLLRKYKFQHDYELAEFLMDGCDVDVTLPPIEPIHPTRTADNVQSMFPTIIDDQPAASAVLHFPQFDATMPPLMPFTSTPQKKRKRVPDKPDSSAHMALESEPSMTDFDSDVHNDDDHSFIQPKKRTKRSNEDIPSAIAAIDEKKFIVFESCLEKLASLSPQKRCKQCNGTVIKQRRQNGTALHIKWVCEANHIAHEWSSQPTFKQGTYIGDLMIASSILLSGNNFSKIELMAKQMNLAMIGKSSYYKYQRYYCFPVIFNFWETLVERNCQDVLKRSVILLGDGRNDSPGHSAKYCTYTAVDQESMEILACVVVDKRETKLKSVNMEIEAFKRILKYMLDRGLNIVEVVTDASSSITKYLREKHSHIFHSYDVWHGAKNLNKKLTKISKTKGNKDLAPWIKDIVNHFWYCCEASDSYEEFVGRLKGILHHVVGRHQWDIADGGISKCDHDEIPEDCIDKPYLTSGSKPHTELRKALFDKRFLRTLPKYLKFRSTSMLESFHQLILMYCSKRFAYQYPAYKARNQLAAIDYSEHKGRQQAVTKTGKKRYHRKFNKKSGNWTVSPVKVTKSYKHHRSILAGIIKRRMENKLVKKSDGMTPDDPKKISATIAPTPPVETLKLIEQHVSRGAPKKHSENN